MAFALDVNQAYENVGLRTTHMGARSFDGMAGSPDQVLRWTEAVEEKISRLQGSDGD